MTLIEAGLHLWHKTPNRLNTPKEKRAKCIRKQFTKWTIQTATKGGYALYEAVEDLFFLSLTHLFEHFFFHPIEKEVSFLGGTSGKEPASQCRLDLSDTGSIPGLERSPGRGHSNPLQYSHLENPMDREA